MLSTLELKRLALREGVPGATVEKDYILSVLLKALANTDLSTKAIFKGGTAIRKVYFKDARFSEDLDFTTLSMDRAECLGILRSTLEGKEYDGVKFGIIEEERTSAGLKAAVKYTGPLNFAQRIRFDFSFRDNLVGKPEQREIIDIYGIGPAKMHVLGIEEVFAEKLHALGSRIAPRDLYDVWFLLGKGVKVDKDLLDRKFAFYNEKFYVKKAMENSKKGEEEWKKDLRQLLRVVPPYATVEAGVRDGLLGPKDGLLVMNTFLGKTETIPDKLQRKVKESLASDAQIDEMRQRLKSIKPMVHSFVPQDSKADIENYYDERIDTLPKRQILDGVDMLEKYEQFKGTPNEEQAQASFINGLLLTFAFKGWLRGKKHLETMNMHKNKKM